MIEVIAGTAPENELPCIEVHTYRNAKGAVISHVTTTENTGGAIRFGTIVDRKPMTHADAVEIATMFARKTGHPRIYARNDAK